MAEPFDLRADLLSGTGSCRGWSSQDEIDQRDKGHTARGGDQGVVGPRVRILVERRLRGLFGHTGDLGGRGKFGREGGHILPISFGTWLSGTGWRHRNW